MSRAVIIFLGALVLLGGAIGYVVWPRGHCSLSVTEVSRPFSASVSAPIRPLGSGALYIIVEGRLDGDATLEVVSNRGRDRREVALRGPEISLVTGGAEEWVDDLQVQYRPGTAKVGRLSVALYCGRGFTPSDWQRYSRISRKQR